MTAHLGKSGNMITASAAHIQDRVAFVQKPGPQKVIQDQIDMLASGQAALIRAGYAVPVFFRVFLCVVKGSLFVRCLPFTSYIRDLPSPANS
ncbi:hypothetical protein SAMN02910292_02632 [Lachnospiraceae bacterium XBB2008]|nr:hypothetical protein SAMN02910292_02632 [Lachnospiraceae bacterium XBB2008]